MLCVRGLAVLPHILEPGRRRSAGCRSPATTAPGRSTTVGKNKGGTERVVVIWDLPSRQQPICRWRKGLGQGKAVVALSARPQRLCARYSCDSGRLFFLALFPGGGREELVQKDPSPVGVAGKGGRGAGKHREKAEPWVSIKRSLPGSLAF